MKKGIRMTRKDEQRRRTDQKRESERERQKKRTRSQKWRRKERKFEDRVRSENGRKGWVPLGEPMRRERQDER